MLPATVVLSAGRRLGRTRVPDGGSAYILPLFPICTLILLLAYSMLELTYEYGWLSRVMVVCVWLATAEIGQPCQ